MKMYPAGENPALSLYSLWETLAEPSMVTWMRYNSTHALEMSTQWHQDVSSRMTWTRAQFPWARERWVVRADSFDRHDKPVFKYGRMEGWYFRPAFILDSEGRFQTFFRSWGFRHALMQGTFLGYSYDASTYRWGVPPDPAGDIMWGDLRNYTTPIYSIEERALNLGAWRELIPSRFNETMWEIGLAHNRCPPGAKMANSSDHDHLVCNRRHDSERSWQEGSDRRLVKRLRRYENADRAKLGLAPLSARTATLRDGNQTLTVAESIARLTVLMDVTAPAKTGTRLTEAQEEITA